ncbi:hypothetical protein BJ684DRAFT_15098, partial [Piptocephalis cylindrospora]
MLGSRLVSPSVHLSRWPNTSLSAFSSSSKSLLRVCAGQPRLHRPPSYSRVLGSLSASVHTTAHTLPALAHGASSGGTWRPASSGARSWIRKFTSKSSQFTDLPSPPEDEKNPALASKSKAGLKKGLDWNNARRLIALAKPESRELTLHISFFPSFLQWPVATVLLCISSAITM